jgi:hypothetical protein
VRIHRAPQGIINAQRECATNAPLKILDAPIREVRETHLTISVGIELLIDLLRFTFLKRRSKSIEEFSQKPMVVNEPRAEGVRPEEAVPHGKELGLAAVAVQAHRKGVVIITEVCKLPTVILIRVVATASVFARRALRVHKLSATPYYSQALI